MLEQLKHWIKYSKQPCVECQGPVTRAQAKHSIFCERCELAIRSARRKPLLVAEILSRYATRFEIAEDIAIERRGENLWCVTVFGGTVLDRDLNRHYEPSPSNRTDEFIAATRFDLDQAYSIAKRYEEKEAASQNTT